MWINMTLNCPWQEKMSLSVLFNWHCDSQAATGCSETDPQNWWIIGCWSTLSTCRPQNSRGASNFAFLPLGFLLGLLILLWILCKHGHRLSPGERKRKRAQWSNNFNAAFQCLGRVAWCQPGELRREASDAAVERVSTRLCGRDDCSATRWQFITSASEILRADQRLHPGWRTWLGLPWYDTDISALNISQYRYRHASDDTYFLYLLIYQTVL